MSSTNSPRMMLASGLLIGSSSSPISLAKVYAYSSLAKNAEPVRVGAAFVLHRIGIAAPVRFFFEQQEIAMLQTISRRQSAHAAADNHDVMPRRSRRPREYFAVAHLMADAVVFAIHIRGVTLPARLFASALCAATSERSIGHPAVTAPATTNLMKSLRFALMPPSLRPLRRSRCRHPRRLRRASASGTRT